MVANVQVFTFFKETINFKGIEEKFTYRHLNMRKYKMKSLKEIFAALCRKISLGCQK